MKLTKDDILAAILIHADIEITDNKMLIIRPDFGIHPIFPKVPPNYSPHKIELDFEGNCVRIWRITDSVSDRPSLIVTNVFTGNAEMKTKEIRGTSEDEVEEPKQEVKVEATPAPEKKTPKKKEVVKAIEALPPAPAVETFE